MRAWLMARAASRASCSPPPTPMAPGVMCEGQISQVPDRHPVAPRFRQQNWSNALPKAVTIAGSG